MTNLLLSSSSNGFDAFPGSSISYTWASSDDDTVDGEGVETQTESTKGTVDKKENSRDNHIALLNSTIAWVETAGAMIATPLLAGSFRLGLSWSGIWTGLPFFLAGCLFLSATVIVLFVRIHDRDDHTTPAPELGHEVDDGDLEDGRGHGRYTPVNQHA